MNPYLADILMQPQALKRVITNFSVNELTPITGQLEGGDFDRLIITGMGSSFNAAYPAFVHLSQLPIPVSLLNSAELLHTLINTISPRTLLWLNTQSGRSAELVNLIQRIEDHPPGHVLACINDLDSPIAKAANTSINIDAGPEAVVSTKTYLNMMAVNLLVSEYLYRGNLETLKIELLETAKAIQSYLSEWQAQIRQLDDLLDSPFPMMILGRGTSMRTIWNGSLINKEAAKYAVEGMNAADFRHGPLELADADFCALIFAGPIRTSSLNRGLALEIVSYGGRVIWIDHNPDPELPTILIPKVSERTRPLVEILPMQMLTLLIAERKGIQAGKFRYVGKVTEIE